MNENTCVFNLLYWVGAYRHVKNSDTHTLTVIVKEKTYLKRRVLRKKHKIDIFSLTFDFGLFSHICYVNDIKGWNHIWLNKPKSNVNESSIESFQWPQDEENIDSVKLAARLYESIFPYLTFNSFLSSSIPSELAYGVYKYLSRLCWLRLATHQCIIVTGTSQSETCINSSNVLWETPWPVNPYIVAI